MKSVDASPRFETSLDRGFSIDRGAAATQADEPTREAPAHPDYSPRLSDITDEQLQYVTDILLDGEWHGVANMLHGAAVRSNQRNSMAQALEDAGALVAESDSGRYWCLVMTHTPTFAPDEEEDPDFPY